MKLIQWRILIITSIVCLLPILFGLIVWDQLPSSVAIHFNIYNQPDQFASKSFSVLGLPVLMVLLQIICCLINDINAHKYGPRKKFELATKWIIPVMSIVLQIAVLWYNLGYFYDVHRVAALLVGAVFLLIGNYLPKFGDIQMDDPNTDKTRRIHRFIGFATVVMGVLFLVSAFLPPMATLICLGLLILAALISTIYGWKIGKK